MPNKTPKPDPEFSGERETRVLLEQIRKEVRTVHEGLEGVNQKLEGFDKLKEDISTLKSDVAVIKAVIPTLATKKDVQQIAEALDKRMTSLEHAR